MQETNTHLELPVLRPAAQDIEAVLEVIGQCQLLIEILLQVAALGHGIEESGAQHTVQQGWRMADLIGEQARRSHDIGHQAEQITIGMQQGEELHPRGQSAQEGVEAAEGHIRISGFGQLIQELRH